MIVQEVKRAKPDEVDRAVLAARRAVGRLVTILGEDDPEVVQRALHALGEIGPFSVGPLASALPRAESPRQRIIIVRALMHFSGQARPAVVRALIAAVRRETDPYVLAEAQASLSHLTVTGLFAGSRAARTSAREDSPTS